MFQKITIIGLGLIGSSLARVIGRNGLATHVTAADISQDVCDVVESLGLADETTSDIAASVIDSDFVILAIPVGALKAVAKTIAPNLADGCVIIDVGSVKKAVIDSIQPHLPENVNLVPCHPIAGTEHSGPEAGLPDLFKERWCILTPMPETSLKAVEKATMFWEACGAKIEIMDANHHDLVLGITSHLPHLIAYTIVGTADALEDDIKSEVIKFSASGFYGFTRIAASDPVMWRDVFLNNKEAVLEILGRFNEDLTAMQKAIRQGDAQFLEDTFTRTRDIRRKVMDQGEAAYPNPRQKPIGHLPHREQETSDQAPSQHPQAFPPESE